MALTLSCKKEKINNDNNNTNNNNNNPPTGFTPPTTNFWKINDVNNDSSADAFSVNIPATHAGLSKPFPNSGYCQIGFDRNDGFSNDSIYREIRSKIPEGGYKEFPISKKKSVGYTPNGDSLSVNLTLTDNGEYYYFISQGGNLYISKKNDKLRFTTKGIIDMIGVKNMAINDYIYSRTVEFSWEEL